MKTAAMVTVEPEGPIDGMGNAESWEVIVWDPDEHGVTVGSFSTQEEAQGLADVLSNVIRAWRNEQFLVTLGDRSQVGFMHGEVHLRRSPGSCWDVPLPKGRPHEPNTVHFGEW